MFKKLSILALASAVITFLLPTSSLAKASQKISGIYKFKASNGKPYTGKSIDIEGRIKSHIRNKKLLEKDIHTIEIQPYQAKKSTLLSIEKTKIRTEDILSNGGLANKQHAPLSRKIQEIMSK